MERESVPDQNREVDGDAEEEADLRVRVAAAIFAGVRRECGADRPPMEPARARWRQCEGLVPVTTPWSREPAPLVREGEAMGAARCEETVSVGSSMEAVRSLQREERERRTAGVRRFFWLDWLGIVDFQLEISIGIFFHC